MPRRKLNYQEGDWIAVPLEDGTFALGRVARSNLRGIVLGYFFRLRTRSAPSLETAESYEPGDAILIAEFGDLGLLDHGWPVIGHSPESWNRDQWPIPLMHRRDLSGRYWIEQHNEQLLGGSERRATADEVIGLPDSGLRGDIALQIELTRLLADVPIT